MRHVLLLYPLAIALDALLYEVLHSGFNISQGSQNFQAIAAMAFRVECQDIDLQILRNII